MYKIIDNINTLNKINEAARLKDKTATSYCEEMKHPTNELWSIPIIEPILKGYNLDNIDYLLSDNIENLPPDWSWPFDNEKIRITIPNNLILKEPYLRALIQYCDENDVKYIVEGDTSCIYVNYIRPDHQYVLDLFPEIIIEEK